MPTLMGQTQEPKPYLYWTWKGTGVPPVNMEEYIAVQITDGTLEYRNRATGAVYTENKSNATSGYAVRQNDWKGVVAHCSGSGVPSSSDVMEIYNLLSDPFETKNLADTDEGKQQFKAFQSILASASVTCACFQC